MGMAEQAYRKRGAKARMARQGGLRPNMRHVQRGSDMVSFVLDVGGKIQSAFRVSSISRRFQVGGSRAGRLEGIRRSPL